MIDLANIETWPPRILVILKERANDLKAEKVKERRKLCDGSYLTWKAPWCPLFDSTVEEVRSLIINREIRAFHCTRLVNWDDIRKYGLRTLNPEFITELVVKEFSKMRLNRDLLESIQLSFKEFKREKGFNNRQNMLWFVLTKKMTEESGCYELFKYFGGEVTRRVLEKFADRVFPILASIGKPSVVECQIKIIEGADYQIDNLVKEIIKYGIKRNSDNRDYLPFAEMYIQSNVKVKNILNIWEKELR